MTAEMMTEQTQKVIKFARRRAFEAIREEVKAMPPDEVSRPTGVRAPVASAVVLRAVAAATPHAAALKGTFVAYNDDWLERLRTLALAAAYAETELDVPTGAPSPVELVEEGRDLRRKLLSSARPLVDVGYLDASVLEMVARSYQDVATHLGELADAFGNQWPQIHDKTVVTRATVKRADAVAQLLVLSLGVEVQNDDTRARVMTMLAKEYGTFRSAIQYLRRDDGDADRIAPALQAIGDRRRPAPRVVEGVEALAVEPAASDAATEPSDVEAPSPDAASTSPAVEASASPPPGPSAAPPRTNGSSAPSVPAPC